MQVIMLFSIYFPKHRDIAGTQVYCFYVYINLLAPFSCIELVVNWTSHEGFVVLTRN